MKRCRIVLPPVLTACCLAVWRVLRYELHRIRRDRGVLLVLFGAPLIYSLLYAAAYAPQQVREIPVAVIDQCHTPSSRRLIRHLDGSEACRIVAQPTDLVEARELLFDRKIYGILLLPADWDRSLAAGRQATAVLYLDGSYLLIYRTLFAAWVKVLAATGTEVELRRLHGQGIELQSAEETVAPIRYEQHNLFNPDAGYATFVMPAVLVLILQQTLLIAIGMAGGRWREEGLYRTLATDRRRHTAAGAVVVGRSAAYLLAELPVALYLFGVHYRLFGYPSLGGTATLVGVLVLYAVAVILLGVALSTLFRRREEPLMLLFWCSIPLLMVSGVSFPREAMPAALTALGAAIPSTHAINAVIRLRTMGASVAEIAPELAALAGQGVIFALFAWLGVRHRLRRG